MGDSRDRDSWRRDSWRYVSPIEISEADLQNPQHVDAIVFLLDAYSREPTANGAPLSEAVRSALVPGLRAHAGTLVFLAHEGDDAVGIAVCFMGYSTFAARSLLNVHDLAVLPAHRGKHVGRRILEAVEAAACARGCCKVTLEVQENNTRARRLYERFGFAAYELDPATGRAFMMQKKL